MTCVCNWQLGMGPNLRCVEHGDADLRAFLHTANVLGDNAQAYENAVLTMFLNFIQTKGAWPCALHICAEPEALAENDVLKLKDEFLKMLVAI